MGQGMSLEDARKQIGMVIEGVDNIEVAYKLAEKYNVDMPIVNTVYDMLYNGLSPKDGVNILMNNIQWCRRNVYETSYSKSKTC